MTDADINFRDEKLEQFVRSRIKRVRTEIKELIDYDYAFYGSSRPETWAQILRMTAEHNVIVGQMVAIDGSLYRQTGLHGQAFVVNNMN